MAASVTLHEAFAERLLIIHSDSAGLGSVCEVACSSDRPVSIYRAIYKSDVRESDI